ncbi:MAG TPA: GTPase Era [Bacilli bacterium]|nr:GTPase Era [Bacilli bacterium]
MKTGFVGIIGRPNVGKSTLINSLVGEKVAIVTEKAGTTRNTIHGIYNDLESQIIFVDTPGIHKPIDKFGTKLNTQAYYSIEDVDIVIFLVDASEKLGKGDMFVIELLKKINKPVFLVINKIDKIKKENILLKIDEYKNLYEFSEIIPVSAKEMDNTKRLIEVIKTYLSEGDKYYNENEITNKSLVFRSGEIVREKLFSLTKDEVPHNIACVVEKFSNKKDLLKLDVLIVVERDSLKKIVIGKNGSMIKEIGTLARKELEEMFDKKVYLALYVKTIDKWRSKENKLLDLGYYEVD